jgi:AbiV family abortive infection protein
MPWTWPGRLYMQSRKTILRQASSVAATNARSTVFKTSFTRIGLGRPRWRNRVDNVDTIEMRPRAASSLAALSDRKFLELLAEGLALLAEHVHKLESSVELLERDKQVRGAVPLRALAEEEAAKFLILLDAVRCPRKPQMRVRQLDRFHNHLAKGLYVEVYDSSPADYGEVRRYVDMLRKSHYLDGPNDVDWVFRNSVVAKREERLYVDYMEDDGGSRWHSPSSWDDIGLRYRSTVIRLVAAMATAGFASVAGLGCVAPLWRDLELKDSLHRRD